MYPIGLWNPSCRMRAEMGAGAGRAGDCLHAVWVRADQHASGSGDVDLSLS